MELEFLLLAYFFIQYFFQSKLIHLSLFRWHFQELQHLQTSKQQIFCRQPYLVVFEIVGEGKIEVVKKVVESKVDELIDMKGMGEVEEKEEKCRKKVF